MGACHSLQQEQNDTRLVDMDYPKLKISPISEEHETYHCIFGEIPSLIVTEKLSAFLYPFERFNLRRTCIYFNDIFRPSHTQLEREYLTNMKYWRNNFSTRYNSFGGWLDISDGKLNGFTTNQIKQLQFFLIYAERMAAPTIPNPIPFQSQNFGLDQNTKNGVLTRRRMSATVTGVNGNNAAIALRTFPNCNAIKSPQPTHRRSIICVQSSRNQMTTEEIKVKKIFLGPTLNESGLRFMCNIFRYSSDTNRLQWIYLNNCGLSDNDLHLLARSLLYRRQYSNIRQLNLAKNPITEKYIHVLFEAIGNNCVRLQNLSLSDCGFSDGIAAVITDFYQKYLHKNTSLNEIYLSYNPKITGKGISQINEMLHNYILPQKENQSNNTQFRFVVTRCGFSERDPNWNNQIYT